MFTRQNSTGHRISDLKNAVVVLGRAEHPVGFFPDSPSRVYDDFEVIETDDFIVISDIEIPDHDPAMLQAALLTAMAKNIKTLIIAGDYLATDNASLNSWAESWAVGNQLNYEGAIGLAIKILEKYVDWFDKIIIIEGNHDDRINRKTGGEVWFGMLLREAQIKARDKCEVIFSRYSYLYVKTRRGYYYICHQDNFSKTPVKLAQEMYNVISGPNSDPANLNPSTEKCHIIVTHCHLVNRGWSPDNLRECIALGTMRDPTRTRYKAKSANKHSEWNQGYGMVKRGYFHSITRRGTDWFDLLGKLVQHAEVVPPSAFNLR